MEKIEEILLNDFNIITRNTDGSFLSLYDVLADVSKIYGGLDEDKQVLLRRLILGNKCSKRRFEEYVTK